MKNTYTLFSRKMSDGTAVWYYRVYDEKGRRRAFATGQRTKTAASTYCNSLLKKGLLIPPLKDNTLFSVFAKDFWNFNTSTYIKRFMARGGSFSRNFAHIRELYVRCYISGYFADKKLSDIKPNFIENWLMAFSDRGLSNSTANKALMTLKLMLDEAVRQEYISVNPCDKVQPLHEKPKRRGILTLHEVKELLHPTNYIKYWDNPIPYTGNFLAAITGLRKGEVRALQVSDIHEDYITVNYSVDAYGLKDTKTHKSREIPIPDMLYKMLRQITPPQGFALSFDNGISPIREDVLLDSLYRALRRLGITEEERKERNICFHSWRHFFNTTLRAGNITDSKTQAITGHSTLEMTEHYTHFTHEDLKEINKVQIGIIEGVRP